MVLHLRSFMEYFHRRRLPSGAGTARLRRNACPVAAGRRTPIGMQRKSALPMLLSEGFLEHH